jgi:isoleucyl-tRNA synthetase
VTEPLYRQVEAQVSFPEMEQRILRFWSDAKVFARSIEQRTGAPQWIFYEGPPTANARPGIHHVEPRAFKDVFCRFQTMQGHQVQRKGGWDCHGLPVEIEVEKQLGITAKRQIEEEIGITRFIELCRASVQRYVDDFEELTNRIGFWVDLEGAYWTMSPDYVETVWWLLKQIWDRGLLEEDFRVVPYCPRCETSLSSHEQHQPDAYRDVSDPSVFVRFPLDDDPDTALVVWTTTPWTLLANVAAAVHPSESYVRVEDPFRDGSFLVLAAGRLEDVVGKDARVVEEMSGEQLVGLRYRPPFDFVETNQRSHTVRPGDFVTTHDGSGIVHLAPYGEDDIGVARRDGLPITQVIDPSGHVVERAGPFGGMWFKDADDRIVADLEIRGLLVRAEPYVHSYPHCWRCGTPLLYYLRRDWYIRTSRIRDRLLESNEATNWQPPTIKHGRFGDWLANNVDWSLSRDRYWGTPLPIWRCTQGHAVCVGSFAELGELAGRDLSDFDPHRPHVDEIAFPCPECGAGSTRVKSVIDAWFDSGSMPFAQWHYPFEGSDEFESSFPADFISEAIDQTRGWFYSLLAISTLVRGRNSYRNVVCLGHIVDADGRKMSKSLGNVLDPWSVLDAQGADALRWYMLTAGTPWSPRRISSDIVQESLRRHLLTLWNTYSFWVTYASLERFDPMAEAAPSETRPELDRWILAELDDTVRLVTDSLEAFDTAAGGRRLERFVDDMSNWYVRRSRRRFWRSRTEADTRAAFHTLWECLVALSQLMAPFTPFVAEEIYTNLTAVVPGAPDSVHLADWPKPDDGRRDDELRRRMALARRVAALGRAARTEARVRIRQPLARALLVLPAAEEPRLQGLEHLVAEELNVRRVDVARGMEDLVTYSIKPNFAALGPRFGPRVRELARALELGDARALVAALEGDGRARVKVDGETIELTPTDLDVRVEGRAGFSLAREGPYGVALDVEITPELEAEGIAREVVRAVQELRKTAGLAVEDRIELWLDSESPKTRAALGAHEDLIAGEVLAVVTHLGSDPAPDAARHELSLGRGVASLALRRARAATG